MQGAHQVAQNSNTMFFPLGVAEVASPVMNAAMAILGAGEPIVGPGVWAMRTNGMKARNSSARNCVVMNPPAFSQLICAAKRTKKTMLLYNGWELTCGARF